MAITPSTMIMRALRLSGEKIIGGTLTTDEQTAYLYDLNAMLDSWSIDPSMINQLLEENHALTTSVGSYSIGPGSQTWDTVKPVKIVDPCFVRDSSNIDYPLEIIDDATYGSISQKTLDGSYPRYLNYHSGNTIGTINLWPEPLASLTLYINSWKQLQQFQSISTPLQMPNGYQRCIEFNFAIEIAGGLESVLPEVAKIARESMAAVRQANTSGGVLKLDAGVAGGRRASILTG